MESRLESLRSVSAGRDELDEKIIQNKVLDADLAEQLGNLQAILNDVQSPEIELGDELGLREAAI